MPELDPFDIVTGARDTPDPELFDLPGDLPRDQWQRPIIYRPWEEDGICPEVRYCPVTRGHGHYARSSTFAGWLDDGIGLSTWKTRHAVLSVSREPDLSAAIAPLEYGDPELDDAIEKLLTRARMDAAANWGSAVHRFTEPYSPPARPERIAEDIAAYFSELDRHHLTPVDSEVFVVNDRLRVAGTLDDLLQGPDGTVRVSDKKTGARHPLPVSMQIATYATGTRYDPATGARSPLHPDLDVKYGILAEIPHGKGTCELLRVDLVRGLSYSFLAREAAEARRDKVQRELLSPLESW